MRHNIRLTLLFLILIIYNYSYAQIPKVISYQGILTNTTGIPKPDGDYSIKFSFYDAENNGNVLWSETKTLSIKKGLFSTLLGDQTPFGSNLKFDKPYWLGIKIANDPELKPRIALSSVAYSLHSSKTDSALYSDFSRRAVNADTAIYTNYSLHSSKADTAEYVKGTVSSIPIALSDNVNYPDVLFTSNIISGDGIAIRGFAPSFAGIFGESQTGYGVYGYSVSDKVAAIYGQNDTFAGVSGRGNHGMGVRGTSSLGIGVYGEGQYGVKGVTLSSDAAVGVWGEADADRNDVRGVYGVSHSPTGNGVVGEVTPTTGNGRGVWGLSNSPSGVGVYGSNSDPNGWAGYFVGLGYFSGAVGIGVTSPTSKLDVNGGSGNGSSVGIHGSSNDNYGIYGTSNSSYGVFGESGNSPGVRARTYNSTSYAVYADYSTSGTNSCGLSSGSYAIYADGPSFFGGTMYLFSNSTNYISGNLHITGDFEASGSKDFRIDHPLDPANKTLVHSCIESNERMLIYSGTVTTDVNGDATINLPSYFESLNTNYRYQLTVVGQDFAQARVSNEISDNKFSIKTDKPNIKICWQVTGDRNDAYSKANPLIVEQEKSADERGKYISPELFGQPKENTINYIKTNIKEVKN